MNYFIIYLSNVAFLEFIKYLSRYLFKPYFVDCKLVCIIFIGSEFIDPETCPRVWINIFSGPYPNWIYSFYSPVGLWKVVVMMPVSVIVPVAINTFIVCKEVPQVGHFFVDCRRFIYKHHIILFLLLGL